MFKKLPWWLKDASIRNKRLYFAGCPKTFWDVRFENLPPRQLIVYRDRRRKIRIKPEQQDKVMRKIHKGVDDPWSVLVISNPTDAPGLALLSWWCQKNSMTLVDLGTPPDPSELDGKMLGLYNLTAESEESRVSLARDYMYRYKDQFRALCVAGVDDPVAYACDTLRFFQFDYVLHLSGPIVRRRTRK